jgi:hypothetical protein
MFCSFDGQTGRMIFFPKTLPSSVEPGLPQTGVSLSGRRRPDDAPALTTYRWSAPFSKQCCRELLIPRRFGRLFATPREHLVGPSGIPSGNPQQTFSRGRDCRFESVSLQGGVSKPSVPQRRMCFGRDPPINRLKTRARHL